MTTELRDYFAAQAPADIPAWFEWKPDRERPSIPSKFELNSEELRQQLEGLGDWLDVKDVHPEVAALADHMARARTAAEQWDRQRDIGRYIAWRWAYADMMIAARQKAEE
ncbi:hypothetical protein C2134_02785 [Chromobacterium sinusclupearum]|uniref:Uncharacterized protein n=1 Tax=Chromobacterium sinusclupearum TaxID=2077146 RepID=A0A2K4MSS4_9NEIS|nr:hypothetical protein [Chromobacterium sinusclupearum]POB00134.1 hypothetical protein C2134_02785 [Chromobacterium sinusclupearum]